MSYLRLPLTLTLAVASLHGCTSTDNTCDGVGDCPAGQVCTAGVCEAVPTPQVDGGPIVDAAGVYDAGAVIDTGVTTTPPGDSLPPLPPADAGPEPVYEAGPVDVATPDLPPVIVPGELALGDACTPDDINDPCVPFIQGGFCQPSVNGQTAYCSTFCVDPNLMPPDAGNECGTGCCVPMEPNSEIRICRYAPDCP